MVSTHDKWIRIFDIPDISKHKNGFIIYKVVSMLYPEACPDAITKVTVWKRFNDFKKLHRDLKVLHRKLKLKNIYPNLPTSTLFKRFDEETIRNRKQGILIFLEFIANNSQLFTSNEFVKFLETSHTPVENLNSNINTIRAELNLPEDPEVCTSLSVNSDDDKTISDTDSVTTMSSLTLSLQADFISETTLIEDHSIYQHSKLTNLSSCSSINSQSSSKQSDCLSISTMLDNMTLIDGQIYPTPPNTPGSLVSRDYMQYVIDASIHINLAVELENHKKYEEAFTAYKAAIDILLRYGKDDPSYDRKQMVRYKTEKYIIRAEKIYNMFLAPEIKNLQLVFETPEEPPVQRPLFDLYKFKVVKIIPPGMLVIHSESQQLFYVKVIHKSMQFLNENLILPENVPYMVKLQSHYNCENALFLVLEYCSGITLSEYLKNRASSDEAYVNKGNQILKHLQDISDNESELSFSDLVNEYASNRQKKTTADKYLERDSASSDDSYEKVNAESLLPNNRRPIKNIMDEPLKEKCEVEDLLSKSQKLLSSVDTVLTEKRNLVIDPQQKSVQGTEYSSIINKTSSSHRKLRSTSADYMEEFDANIILPRETVVKWAAQLLLSLEKLHTLGVICWDLEMKNILIDEKEDLVLTYMCNIKDRCDLFSNGINYNLAPEVYSFHKVTTSADWWSYGAILYELLVGVPLAHIHSNGLSSFSHLKVPKYVSSEGRSILKQLLTYEPCDRLGSSINGTENIKSHPFFNAVSWETLHSTFH